MRQNQNKKIQNRFFEVGVFTDYIVISSKNTDDKAIKTLLRELEELGLSLKCEFNSPCG